MASEDSEGFFNWAVRVSFIVAVVSMLAGALAVLSYFNFKEKHEEGMRDKARLEEMHQKAVDAYPFITNPQNKDNTEEFKAKKADYDHYMVVWLKSHPKFHSASTQPAATQPASARNFPKVYELEDFKVVDVHNQAFYAAGYLGTGLILVVTAFMLVRRLKVALFATMGALALNLIVAGINAAHSAMGGAFGQMVIPLIIVVLGAAAIFMLTQSFGAFEEESYPTGGKGKGPAGRPPTKGLPPHR